MVGIPTVLHLAFPLIIFLRDLCILDHIKTLIFFMATHGSVDASLSHPSLIYGDVDWLPICYWKPRCSAHPHWQAISYASKSVGKMSRIAVLKSVYAITFGRH